MKKIKQTIKIFASFLLISTFLYSAKAIDKKNIFKTNNKMFIDSDIEKDLIESYVISLNNKSEQQISGPAMQIFMKCFIPKLVKDFGEKSGHNIKKYIDNNEFFTVEKAKFGNKFAVNVDFNKRNIYINKIINDFKEYINSLDDKTKLQKVLNATTQEINKNFESKRKEIIRELNNMKKYYQKRREIFNNYVSNRRDEFLKDFKKFGEIVAKFHENLGEKESYNFNLNKNKNTRKLHKEAKNFRKDVETLNVKSKIFKLYENKLTGPTEEKIEEFIKNFKNVLNKVSKKSVKNCANIILENGLKINKF